MTRYFVCCVALCSIVHIPSEDCTADGSEMRRADSILLNGDWECAFGEGTESAHTRRGQEALQWKSAKLPGRFVEWNEHDAVGIRFVWLRRDFDVTAYQAERLAVLRWNRIDYGNAARLMPKVKEKLLKLYPDLEFPE